MPAAAPHLAPRPGGAARVALALAPAAPRGLHVLEGDQGLAREVFHVLLRDAAEHLARLLHGARPRRDATSPCAPPAELGGDDAERGRRQDSDAEGPGPAARQRGGRAAGPGRDRGRVRESHEGFSAGLAARYHLPADLGRGQLGQGDLIYV